MRRMIRLTAVATAVLLTGCVDLVGLIDGRPDSYVERDGLSYQVIVDESPYDYDVFEYRIRITNTSHRTIERSLPVRLGTPRVYRDERWSHPVWNACDWGCEYYGDRVRIRLRAGEAVEGWWGEVWAGDFARYRGTYHLVLLIDTGRHRFEVLGLPELHVW
ncbi:MAG: hypothetical protein R3314_03025 [Longimicrobiales bacterium]|nr:hypothetical protein [Longimicrobiales bacterium]